MVANYGPLFENKQFTYLTKTMTNELPRMNWERVGKFISHKTQKIMPLFSLTQGP
jgi:hypothetical protein